MLHIIGNPNANCKENITPDQLGFLNMQTWYERLKERRLELGYKQADVWRAVGVSNATASSWEKGEQKPKGENLDRLCRFLRTAPGWILYGTGPKEVISGTLHARLSPPVPELSFSGHANVEPGPDMRGLVPIISWVQAGAWHEAIDNGQPWDGGEGVIACPWSHGINTYALRVRGDSMTSHYGRSYPEGCLIYVDPDQRGGVVTGDRVIAREVGAHDVTFKVFVQEGHRRYLKPLNPQHPLITDPFDVLGKVLGALID